MCGFLLVPFFGKDGKMVDIRQTDVKNERLSLRIPAALAAELKTLAAGNDVAVSRQARAALLVGVKAMRQAQGAIK